MPTAIEWTLTVVSDIVHSGIIMAILYTLRRFYKHRYSQALQKRSPLLVYLMNLCFIFYLLNHIAYKIAYIHGESNFDIDPILTNNDQIDHQHIISLISVICYIFSLHGMAIMWIARSWKIYFNSKYGLEVQKSEWGMHLNDHYSDTLWFVKHRKDYGSNRVIYPIAIIWYLGQATFALFFTFMYPDIQRIYDMACWLIEFIVIVIIWNKIPTFNDIFGIKRETQLMFRLGGIALILYIGWTIKVIMLGYDLWTFMIAQFIFGILVGIMALILNAFIFHNSNYKHLVSSTLEVKMSKTLSASKLFQAVSPREKLSLSQVLGNEQLIQCLFQHLTDEFSVELLLALIEFKQFHDLMMNDDAFVSVANFGDIRISESILSTLSFSDELPKSNIVHENHREEIANGNHIRRYLGIAGDLFNKYVSTRAEFEVNLSYECRQIITNFIQEHGDLSGADPLSESDKFELFVLFDEASNELYRLLRSSHDRYVRANKYCEIAASSPPSV